MHRGTKMQPEELISQFGLVNFKLELLDLTNEIMQALDYVIETKRDRDIAFTVVHKVIEEFVTKAPANED